MRYLTAELVLYKRLQLNNIKRFLINFDDPMQIILGKNGSGKSSILSEITPLPSNTNDYLDGGKKIITAEHRGAIYKFTSSFEGKSSHSFIKDGVEMNPGGTADVQKKLCKQEFNITPDIQKLIMGKKRFTQMSPSDRRYWFTQMADADYDFAIKLYNSLMSRHRDVKGALKRSRERLVEEAARQLTPEEQERIKKEVADHHEMLTILMEQRAPIHTPIEQYQVNLAEAVTELNDLSKRLFMIKFQAPYGRSEIYQSERDDWGVLRPVHYTSIGQVEEAITRFNSELAIKEALISRDYTEFNKLKETKAILEKTGSEGIDSLRAKLEQQRQQRDIVRQSTKLKLVFPDVLAAKAAYGTIVEPLQEVFNHIAINDDRQYTQAGRDKLEKDRYELKERIKALEVKGNRLTANKNHMESHKNSDNQVVCPKCTHRWNHGFDEGVHQEIVKQLEETILQLEGLNNELKKLEEDYDNLQQYMAYYRQYSQIVRSTPALQLFWDYLVSKQTITHNPRSGINELIFLQDNITAELTAMQIEKEIIETTNLIAAKTEMGDQNLNTVIEQMTTIQVRIDSLTNEKEDLAQAIIKHQNYRKQLEQSQMLSERIEQQLNHVESIRTEQIEMIRRDTINHCIRQVQSNLSAKEESLKKIEIHANLIKNLECNIQSLELEFEATGRLVKEMSPTDGMIAEGLLGFIAEFTKKMNSSIKEIWSYLLEIHTCRPTEEGNAELDYQFPMSVGRRNNVIDDVSNGSSGIMEVVDLAFRVSAMNHLGLDHTPIVLDEFGITFDEKHQVEAANTVRRLLERNTFSQIFMVSHYSASYGTLNNAQICVLSPDNITIPESMRYNKHVVFE